MICLRGNVGTSHIFITGSLFSSAVGFLNGCCLHPCAALHLVVPRSCFFVLIHTPPFLSRLRRGFRCCTVVSFCTSSIRDTTYRVVA